MKNAIKKILAFVLVIAMIAGVLPSVFAADIVEPFTDVKTSDWFADYVEFVYEHEPQLMNGMTETTFVPQGTCTRAMAAVVLYRLADPVVPSIKPSTFTDLTLDWYKNGIAWAQANGVVNGVTETTFVPEGLVTREQLVTMLWRYAGEPAVNGDFLKDFPDANMVAPYAEEAFNWAISLGIIGGANGYLNPKGNATRAEFAKILYVFIQTNTPCEHKWDDGKVTKPATCIETGIMTYTCELCGATKEEEIPLGDHSYVDGACEYCGDKLADKGEIVIYYTNDVHTYIDKALSYDSVADLKQQTAKVADGVLLVDAGDHIQGTAYGSMDKGANIISMMSAAGYDVATLGNHEFDYGMARTLEITKQADYDYLSCNFYNEKNGVRGENVLDSYKMFDLGGKKVALVGVTTPESFTKSTPKYFQDDAGNYIYGIAGGTDGKALYADVQKAIDEAKKDGADYIIALGHLGDDPASDPWNSEDVIKNVSGLNAFIDGHSHSTVETKNVNGKDGKPVVLTQTGQYFDAIGKMTIKDDKITTELITSYDGSDETVAGIKDKWIEEVDGLLGEVFGHTSLTLDNYKGEERLVRKQETNTGDFAADALYYLFDTTEGLDVDVAIMNGGGVRNKAITGDISYKTCKDIHTFGNVACLQTVTGQQILDALEWGAKDAAADGSKENGGFLQVAGLTYEIHTYIPSTVRKDDKNVWTGGPTGEYRVKNVKVWDKASGAYVALDLNAKYNLAGYNYTLRDLGDGFAMFAGAVNVKDFVMEDYMVLANYVKSFAKVSNKHEIIANSTAVPYGSDYSTVNGSGRIVLKNENPGGNDFGLLSSLSQLKTGDEVIIYNVGGGKAVPATMQGSYYLAGYDVTPADGKIAEADADASIVWTVTVNSDGTYTFTNGTDVLSINYDASAGKGNLSLDGANPNLAVVLQSGKTDTFNIYSATQTGKYEHVYLEWYAQFSDFSAYDTGANNAAKADYGYQFYVKGLSDEECPHTTYKWDGKVGSGGYHTLVCAECGQATKKEACSFVNEVCSVCGAKEGGSTEDFGLLSSLSQLKTGDEVIIYNVGGGKAVPATMQGSYYLAGYDVTPADGKIAEADADASIVWTVTVNSDGTYTFTNGTDVLSINYDASAGKGNLSLDGANPNLAVVLQSGKTDTFNIYSATQTGKYEHVYLEWYAQFSDFSAYDTGANNAAKADYGYQFYVKGLKDDPPPPPPPITGDTYAKVTSDLGDWSGTYVIAYETSATSAFVFNGTNDADMNYVEAAISDGKIKVSSDCAIVIEKSGSGYTFKAKGGYLDGKMASGAAANGTTFSAEAKVGNVSWDSTNKTALLTSAVGTVMRFNNGAKYEGEGNYAWFRFYKTNSSIQTPVSLYKLTDSPIVEHSYAWNGEVGEDGYHTLVCADCGATQQEACTFEDGFCTVCGAEEPIPSDDDFYMIYDLSELMDGDEVIIYNVGGGKAVPATMQGSYYLAGYDVTPEDEVIAAADADDSIVWTVSINDDGSYTFTNGSSILSINYNGKTSLSLDGANPKLAVVPQSGKTDTFNIYSATLTGSYEHIYLEWYAQFSDFSAYDTGSGNAAKADFGYQFFVRGDFEPLPDPGDADWIVLYNKDSGSIIGYNEETDMNEDTYEYSYWNISTEDVAVSGTKLTADFANAGTFYVIDNGDGTYSFVDQYNYDYGLARYLTAETPDTYYDYTDEYAPFEVIPTTGGYLLRNVEDNSYYAIEDGLVAAKALVKDDPSFVFQFAAVVDIEEVGEEDANLICEIYDSIDDVIFFGETIDDCKHENTELQGAKTPSCTAAGYTGDLVCLDCGATIEEGTVIGKLNHVDEDKDGYCDVCETEINPDTEEIVIFYPADNKVMTTEEYTYTGKTTKIELVAADATLKDGAVSTEADNVAKFTVVEGDGYVTFATADGKYLYADGTDVKLVDTEGDNTQFVIEEVSGGVYLKCANAQYQGKAQYIEFYSGYFTVYGMGTNTAIYTFKLCPLGEAPAPCDHVNTELQGAKTPSCTAAGYTGDLVCLDCGATIEEGTSIAALGHIDEDKDGYCDRCTAEIKAGYTVAASISVGDKIVIVANHDGTDYAAVAVIGGSDTKVNNALSARTASISDGALLVDDEAAIVWEVVAGSVDGTFMLKASDGKYLAYTSSGTTLKTANDGTEFAITCGAGTAKIMATAEGMTNRGVSFRNNEGVAQFRLYTETNNSGQYSWNLTIYKLS